MDNIITSEAIAKSLPDEVLAQKIYKCKVVFLDTDKRDPGYTPVKKFSANYHEYSVVDGETSYLPEEAYAALTGAVSYISKPVSRQQEQEGINHENPADKYEKVPVKRFDVTVIDVLTLVVDESGKKSFRSSTQQISKLEIEETQKAIIASKVTEETERIQLELEEKYAQMYDKKIKELEKSLTPATDDKEIEKLLGDE